VVGDGDGRIGMGKGKAREVPVAVTKAMDAARRNMVKVSLKNGSIDVIRRHQPRAVISRPVADTIKGTVAHLQAPADSVRRAAEPARPAWLVFPRYEAGAPTRRVPVARARAFMRMAENAFNYSVLGQAGFDALAGMVGGAEAFEFRYSALDEAIAHFATLEPAAP